MVGESNSGDGLVTYMTIPLLELFSEKELPGNIYLCINHKMIRFRNAGDRLDAEHFNKLVYSHVRYVFIEETHRAAFQRWMGKCKEEHESLPQVTEASQPPVSSEEMQPITQAVGEQRRVLMDIFESPRDDRQVIQAVDTSKKMVSEFLRKPYAANNVLLLQRYSKGILDHSVNVSVLSVYLGLRMGYSHQLILENLAVGALFHDIGKTLVESKGELFSEDDNPQMQKHPTLGAELLEKNPNVPNEVRLIVAQHHECLDGSGYPRRLKGLAVYDLARVVAIANTYDLLISQSLAPTLRERASDALDRLEREFQGKFDPKKLEKAIKILRYSFL